MTNKFTSSHDGKPSAGRLMSFLSLATAIMLALIQVLGLGSGEIATELPLYFLGAAFTGKVAQTWVETTKH